MSDIEREKLIARGLNLIAEMDQLRDDIEEWNRAHPTLPQLGMLEVLSRSATEKGEG